MLSVLGSKFKKFSTSLKAIILFFIVIVVWMLSGLFSEKKSEVNSVENHKNLNYKIVDSKAVDIPKILNFAGTIEAKNQIDLINEVDGKVIDILASEGQKLAKNDPIIDLEKKDYLDKLNSAKENLVSKEVLYESALKLSKKGLGSESNIADAKAQFYQAKGQLKQAQLNLDNTTIRAPYDGIINEIDVKKSNYLTINSKVGKFTSNQIIKIKFEIPYQQFDQIKNSIGAYIFINGQKISIPRVSSLSEIANELTKTYTAEIITENFDNALKSGQLVKVFVDVGNFKAHKISQSTLSIDKDGFIGVKVVNNNSIVEFVPVEIIDEDKDGFWVINLPNFSKIITLGHVYLKSGEKL
jgi:multidrug efflux system membrane fusion protein